MTAVETTNGRVKGRAAPAPTFTFPDSGVTVVLPRFAPDTQAQIAQALNQDADWHAANVRPAPPLQTVEAIDGPMDMPNADDPAYKQAMSRYLALFSAEVGRRMLELAIDLMEVEVDHDAVARRKAAMARIGAPFGDDADDRTIYIRQIAISSAYDAAALMAHIQGTTAPSKEGIQAALDMFQHLLSRSPAL